ncbi:MAG: glycine--tRNA ligase subunit beta [Gammaproteobacteria bacterium]|nr:glycine--tRNA ligase subunit beta [Gammaproteobacteria bacterium]
MNTFDFLFELGTEELPPKSLKKLSNALTNGICGGLKEAGINFAEVESFAAPRRLAVSIKAVDARQSDQEIERLGPNVKAAFDKEGNPTPAALGFAKSNGVEFSELTQVETPKGTRLQYKAVKPGAETTALIQPIIEAALAQLPIAKRMRWGASRNEFVRPVQWVVLMADDQVIDACILGISAGNTTRGHRFHANQEVVLNHANDYEQALESNSVIASFERRKQTISEDATALGSTLNGRVVINPELLDEVTALVELPVVMHGNFDKEFLEVPAEALISSMEEHQKYFYVVDNLGKLMPNFVFVSNIKSVKPESVIEGNEKVIRPRLADAAFFYQTDLKTTLESKLSRLENVVFQKQLGTIAEKSRRVAELAKFIAPLVNANIAESERAALLAKADLVSEMVLEFDDLQGIAGSYYAAKDGEPHSVANAIKEQYLPKFAGDNLPSEPVATTLALAERIDTLAGIFAIGQLPTGSKDPFALRRASIAVLRILIENKLDISLTTLFNEALNGYSFLEFDVSDVKAKVETYCLDRFRAWYDDPQISTEAINAVLAKDLSSPYDIDARIREVAKFASSDDAESLAAATKRVSNILSKADFDIIEVDSNRFEEEAEKVLYEKLKTVLSSLETNTSRDYDFALTSLSQLRDPIDTFFDDVMVNAEDESVKRNRYALLQQLRNALTSVADISRLVV